MTIPEPERDPQLTAKLQAELPGILAWAVRGAVAWRADEKHPEIASPMGHPSPATEADAGVEEGEL